MHGLTRPAYRFLSRIALIAAVVTTALTATSAVAGPLLWNKLDSTAAVLNSAFGPDLEFYGGGSWPDVVGNPGYVPGVFGNAVTLSPGSYGIYDREHNVVWNNLDQYLNPDRGTIEVWYKQNEDPVAYSHGVYRIFDGSYGLSSGMSFTSEAATSSLNFGLGFGGTYTGVSCDISAYNGTWIHLAGVWDRDGIGVSADKIRLYVNGASAASTTLADWGTLVGQQADIAGGNDGAIAGKFAVDNLKVFDTALTDFTDRFDEAALPEPGGLAVVVVGALSLCRRRRSSAMACAACQGSPRWNAWVHG